MHIIEVTKKNKASSNGKFEHLNGIVYLGFIYHIPLFIAHKSIIHKYVKDNKIINGKLSKIIIKVINK